MVLYKSSLITLDYEPATDILFLNWPDVQNLFVAAMEQEMKELLNTINHYDIKKLLIDTSRALITVDGPEYQKFLVAFAKQLMSTRLQKVARIGTSDPVREKLVNDSREISQISDSLNFKMFQTKAEALAWLQE